MLKVCETVGFKVNPSKTVQPTTQIEFLGIWIDTGSFELRLSDVRLADLMEELTMWMPRKRAKKRALLSLIGKLTFAARVVRAGRSFLRRMIDASTRVKHLHHYVKLDNSFKADLRWWTIFLKDWNGISIMYEPVWLNNCDMELYTDASNLAIAGYYRGDWFVELTSPVTSINYREFRGVVLSAATWGHQWTSKRILFHCDNLSVVHIMNSGTSRSTSLMSMLRSLLYLAAVHQFEFRAVYINTHANTIADALSRLDFYKFWHLAPDANIVMTHPIAVPANW